MTDYTPGAIAPERADELTASFSADRANRVARNAVTAMNVHAAARDVTTMRTYHDTFAVSRARTGKVTNQRHSGRCWMFAAFNVARAATMDLLDVDDFEFSQAFGFFYDKLEKFNVGLEYVIETAALPLDSREVSGLLSHCMGDGNYYPAAMNIIRKWGLVPKDAMPESACTKDADQMNAQLERLFRKSAMELFMMQVELASALNLPIIIHTRDADTEIEDALSSTSFNCRGIMHCFSSDERIMRKALDKGLYISFAGNITYKGNEAIRRCAAAVPIDRLLYETDSPYLAPIPMRGKPSRPEYTEYTLSFIAELRNDDADSIRESVKENLFALLQRNQSVRKLGNTIQQ